MAISLAEAMSTSHEKLAQMSVNARETAAKFTFEHAAQYLYEAAVKASQLKTNSRQFQSVVSHTCQNKVRGPVGTSPHKPVATISLDLDNKWAYLKSQGNPAWESFPSYLDSVVPTILSTLDEFGLKITFFIVGQDAVISKNQKPLRMIAEAGHEIANHTFHHETSLHDYTPELLAQELQMAEKAIEDVIGRRTVGFRGPGFSLSDLILQTLQRRGYVYDCSSFPTFLSPLARTYYSALCAFGKNRERQQPPTFGKLNDGFLPLTPYLWNSDHGELLEIPVTTFPLIKTPIHGTYLQFLASYSNFAASTYYSSALTALKLFGVSPSFLLHPLDFIGGDDEPDLKFFPGMSENSKTKLERIRNYIQKFAATYEVLTMRQFADIALSRELARKSTSFARSGASS